MVEQGEIIETELGRRSAEQCPKLAQARAGLGRFNEAFGDLPHHCGLDAGPKAQPPRSPRSSSAANKSLTNEYI
jgi:hypothetical protein